MAAQDGRPVTWYFMRPAWWHTAAPRQQGQNQPALDGSKTGRQDVV